MAYHIFGVEKPNNMPHMDAVSLVKEGTSFQTYEEAKTHITNNLKGKTNSNFWFPEYVILEVI